MSSPKDSINPRWTLRRRVVALCALMAAVLTLLAGGAAVAALANRGQLETLLADISPMTVASGELLQAILDEDASIRAFVVTVADPDLAAYRRAIGAEQRRADEITANRGATPEIKRQLAFVTDLTTAWRGSVAEPAIVAVRKRGARAGQAIINANARSLDGIRSAVDILQATMLHERNEAAVSVRDTNTTLLFVLVVATLLVVASGVGMLVALQRVVIGPVTDLADQVRSVALGSYHQAISTTGPPELESLATDVDTMRRQIASDLAEVQHARQQIEEANLLLEQQAAELTRSNRDLEQFAYVASHDLQEPLRKVASFCQLLQRRYAGQLDERADQYIGFAVDGAQRMQRLIHDLLAFSRIGRVSTAFVDIDLTFLIDEAVAQFDGELAEPGTDISWDKLPVVHGAKDLLSTLFANLIGNSIKFRRPGQPLQVRISARPAGERFWEISCTDNGIGIEPEFADKVFVIFQRLHSRDAYPGTGIGLAVAKKIVEYHDGQIWIDTDYHDGTAIRFTLPMATRVRPQAVAVKGIAP